MTKITTYSYHTTRHFTALAVLLLCLLCWNMPTYGQTKVYANSETHSSHVDNPGRTIDTDYSNFATLHAYGGAALGLGAYSSYIELQFPQTLSADTWSYVQIDQNGDLLKALLGGSLGNALAGVLGSLLIGNQEITIDARMGSTSILKRNSNQGFGTDRVKLLRGADGGYYLAIRPDQSYDRIRITNKIITLLLSNVVELKVYHAFYYNNTAATNCDNPIFTSFDGSNGLGLEVLDLQDQHLDYAIDNDTTTFSTLKSTSTLDLGVANTLSQYFYFPSESDAGTTLNIKIALGSGGLVNTDLLGAIEVILYDKDNNVVYDRALQSSLLNNTNALNLLDNGQPITVTLAPGVKFQKAEVRLNSPVGLSLLGNGVKIYNIQRYNASSGCANPKLATTPSPSDSPLETPSCSSSLVSFDNTDFPLQAADGNNETYARLYANSGNLLVSGPSEGYVELDMGSVNPGETTYIRINYSDENLLGALLGGSLGQTVGGLLNGLLLGNAYFDVEVKDATGTVLSGSSSDGFSGTTGGTVRLVQDSIGRNYIAVTPTNAYTSIRITNKVNAALSTGKTTYLDIYGACFETGTTPCFPANFTSYYGNGLNLSVGNLSAAGVTDAFKAIDGNSSSYSNLSFGVAGVAASTYQSIYFSHPSQPNDTVAITMMINPSSLLDLSLLGNYKVKFYNNETQVGTDYSLQDGVPLISNIDLLALFSSGGVVELTYVPTGVFNRVDIGIETTVGISTTQDLRIYDVERYGAACPRSITPSPFDSPSCSTSLIDASNADNVQNLFDDDFDSYATLKSGSGLLLGIGQTEGFVEMGYPTTVPAGETSYIRIDFDAGILEKLVSGSLGNLVTDLLGGILTGNHYFKVTVKRNTYDGSGNVTNTVVVDQADSHNGAQNSNDAIRVVQDNLGRYYIAVTPTGDYNAIRITDISQSLIGPTAPPNTMNVYGMCRELSINQCLPAQFTSYEYSGINLAVDAVGTAGVTNPYYAIDANTTNYSEISNGTLAIGASTKQWIYFPTASANNDVVNITFSTSANVTDVDVLGGLQIIAYDGATPVDTLDWGPQGIVNGINILQLLSNGQTATVSFAPGVQFDRISVGIETLISVAIMPPLHLYSVQRCMSLPGKTIANPNTTNKL